MPNHHFWASFYRVVYQDLRPSKKVAHPGTFVQRSHRWFSHPHVLRSKFATLDQEKRKVCLGQVSFYQVLISISWKVTCGDIQASLQSYLVRFGVWNPLKHEPQEMWMQVQTTDLHKVLGCLGKLTWQWKITILMEDTYVKLLCFSIIMLVFGWVPSRKLMIYIYIYVEI